MQLFKCGGRRIPIVSLTKVHEKGVKLMANNHYELILIGGGTVSFDGLQAAKQLGVKRILMIEKEKIGGTCLNWG